MEFTTRESGEILNVAVPEGHQISEQRIRNWAAKGGLLYDAKRLRRDRELIFSFKELLAMYICIALEEQMKGAHNSVAAWMTGLVMQQLDGVPWANLPEEVSIALTDKMTVNVNAREFADALKAKAAIWQVQSGRRVC